MLFESKSEKIRYWLDVSVVWALITQATAAIGAWAIVSGGNTFRMFALGTVAAGLLVPLTVSLEAGMLAMVIFEPFRGVLRRAQYLIVPYSQNEPIHLITPFVAFVALLSVLFREKLSMFWSRPLSRPVLVLAVICFLQIFNPIQGGLFIGLSGALFILVPMAWFYFGQTVTWEFFGRLFKFVVVLAVVASLYGIYQVTFGYPEFELYWLNNTDKYSSIDVYNIKRALATFSNAEEWGRYVQLGSICAFGFGMMPGNRSRQTLWFAAGIALIGMLALTGQRSSIFGLFLGLSVLLVTGARTLGNGLLRLGAVFLPVILVFTFVTALSTDDIYEFDESKRVNTMLSHTARGTVNPIGEGSLAARMERWTRIVTEVLPANPMGYGLGATTTSASREQHKDKSAIDNHFLSLAVSAGVPAALLLLWILFRASKIALFRWFNSDAGSDEAVYWRLALALLSSFFLNNFFGTTFTIYSVAPLGWFLIGWISRPVENETANVQSRVKMDTI
jgi:O-Antigen ligase